MFFHVFSNHVLNPPSLQFSFDFGTTLDFNSLVSIMKFLAIWDPFWDGFGYMFWWFVDIFLGQTRLLNIRKTLFLQWIYMFLHIEKTWYLIIVMNLSVSSFGIDCWWIWQRFRDMFGDIFMFFRDRLFDDFLDGVFDFYQKLVEFGTSIIRPFFRPC